MASQYSAAAKSPVSTKHNNYFDLAVSKKAKPISTPQQLHPTSVRTARGNKPKTHLTAAPQKTAHSTHSTHSTRPKATHQNHNKSVMVIHSSQVSYAKDKKPLDSRRLSAQSQDRNTLTSFRGEQHLKKPVQTTNTSFSSNLSKAPATPLHQGGRKQLELTPQNVKNIQQVLQKHSLFLQDQVSMILNNSKVRVNLREVEKKGKDLSSQFKLATQDTLMLQMMKDA